MTFNDESLQGIIRDIAPDGLWWGRERLPMIRDELRRRKSENEESLQ